MPASNSTTVLSTPSRMTPARPVHWQELLSTLLLVLPARGALRRLPFPEEIEPLVPPRSPPFAAKMWA